jgi:hypothetical protein
MIQAKIAMVMIGPSTRRIHRLARFHPDGGAAVSASSGNGDWTSGSDIIPATRIAASPYQAIRSLAS